MIVLVGRKLIKRKSDGTCEWGEKLTKQCMGLGDEQKSPTGEKLNTESCKKSCCDSKDCEIWQEIPGRGCCKSVYYIVLCWYILISDIYDNISFSNDEIISLLKIISKIRYTVFI